MTAPARRVAVATSGGRDSTALLHCTQRAAAALGIEVHALHVHHGLLREADAWQAHVERQCRRWRVPLDVARLAGSPAPGDSIEAWARRERYRALTEMALQRGITLVLLAHHRRDQAETFLLQALRGGGPAGLAAMPSVAQRQGVTWARPWLDQPRTAIETYAKRHRLAFVDDPSNADPRFARSRLRALVWPVLDQAFPDAEQTLAAAAGRAAEAAQALGELAALDAESAVCADGLRVARWMALSPSRRANLLRAWLTQVLQHPPPQSLVRRVVDELPGVVAAGWPAGDVQLRLHRGLLRVVADPSLPPPPPPADLPATTRLDLHRAGRYGVPGWAGTLHVRAAAQGGVLPERLVGAQAVPRRGGERFRLAPRALPRSLKKQYQACGVPAWQREGPLIFTADGQLLFAPGLGIDAAQQATPGQRQLVLHWESGPRGATGERQRAD